MPARVLLATAVEVHLPEAAAVPVPCPVTTTGSTTAPAAKPRINPKEHKVSRQRAKGTALETLMTRYLSARLGDDRIMRMPLSGAKDRGDIAGIRTVLGERVVVEVKNHASYDLAGWVGEVEVERGNADAQVGVVVFKRRGRGLPGDQFVLMTAADFVVLLGGDRG